MFECLSKLKVTYVKCHLSSVNCQLPNAYADPWEMLNNFCFHVYAQKSLFIGENGNAFNLGPQPPHPPHTHPVLIVSIENPY